MPGNVERVIGCKGAVRAGEPTAIVALTSCLMCYIMCSNKVELP